MDHQYHPNTVYSRCVAVGPAGRSPERVGEQAGKRGDQDPWLRCQDNAPTSAQGRRGHRAKYLQKQCFGGQLGAWGRKMHSCMAGALASSLICDTKGCVGWAGGVTSLRLLVNKIRLLQLCSFSKMAELEVL